MKCKIVDNECGARVLYVSKRFEETDLNISPENDSSVYTVAVLFDEMNASLIRMINKKYHPGRTDVCILCKLCESDVEELFRLKTAGIIRNLTIAIDRVYDVLQIRGTALGYEDWGNQNCSAPLKAIDDGKVDTDTVRELIPRVDEVINEILLQEPSCDLEKVLLVDIWMQSQVQYIKGKISDAPDGKHICDGVDRDSLATDVLINHYGRCEDIAFTAALILNNPRLGIGCRQVGDSDNKSNHSWNIIRCSGKEYYMDFTHNITRNPDRFERALKARSYHPSFTLLGRCDAEEKYSYNEWFENDEISMISLPREEIESALLNLQNKGAKLSWDIPPVHNSVLQTCDQSCKAH